jgi:hypothetical protein
MEGGDAQQADLSNYSYFPQILIAVLIVDLIVIFLVRFFPGFWGSTINVWYDRFGLSAVLADVLIIVLGFFIGQYIYKNYLAETYGWNPAIFAGLLVVVQVVHDLLFYFGVIKPIPKGHNEMMDVFKTYAEKGGAKVIVADSAMMLGSFGIATALANASEFATVVSGVLATYALPYILTTRWK